MRQTGWTALCTLAVAALIAGCSEDDSGKDEADKSGRPAAQRDAAQGDTVAPADDLAADERAPDAYEKGDRCDQIKYDVASELPPELDCERNSERIVAAGDRCDPAGSVGSDTVAGHLLCEDGEWVGLMLEPGTPGARKGGARPSPGVGTNAPVPGGRCVPGQPLPPHLKCE